MKGVGKQSINLEKALVIDPEIKDYGELSQEPYTILRLKPIFNIKLVSTCQVSGLSSGSIPDNSTPMESYCHPLYTPPFSLFPVPLVKTLQR